MLRSLMRAAVGTTAFCGAGSCIYLIVQFLKLERDKFEQKKRLERTQIVFKALSVATALVGSYLTSQRHKQIDERLDASLQHERNAKAQIDALRGEDSDADDDAGKRNTFSRKRRLRRLRRRR